MEPKPILKKTATETPVASDHLGFFDTYNYGDEISAKDAFTYSGTTYQFKPIGPFKPVIVRVNDFAGLRFYFGAVATHRHGDLVGVQFAEEHFEQDCHIMTPVTSVYSIKCPNLSDTVLATCRSKKVRLLNKEIKKERKPREENLTALDRWALFVRSMTKANDEVAASRFPFLFTDQETKHSDGEERVSSEGGSTS